MAELLYEFEKSKKGGLAKDITFGPSIYRITIHEVKMEDAKQSNVWFIHNSKAIKWKKRHAYKDKIVE